MIRVIIFTVFLLLTACSDERLQGDTAHHSEDSAAHFDTASLDLHGTWPKKSIAAPEFTAHNFDNTTRGRDDLIGHPSVLWFYPAAGTFG